MFRFFHDSAADPGSGSAAQENPCGWC